MFLKQLEFEGGIVGFISVDLTVDVFEILSNKDAIVRITRLILDFHKFLLKNSHIMLIFDIKPFHNNFQHFPILLNKRIPGHKGIHQRYLKKLIVDVLKRMRSIGNAKIVHRWIKVQIDW
jgi:hypothetical protein